MNTTEGFSRRRSEADIQLDLNQQLADAKQVVADKKKDAIVADVHEIDASQKRLTGRQPAEYAWESGVPLEELFPEGGEILNIGDPWQTLDLSGVTSIDYEYGEEAEFIHDVPKFLTGAPKRVAGVAEQLSYLLEHTKTTPLGVNIEKMQSQIKIIEDKIAHAKLDDYPGIGDELLTVASMISTAEERQKNDHDKTRTSSDSYAHALKELWYEVERLSRGFHDSYLTKTVIDPEISRAVVEQRGLTNEETEQLKRTLIEKHRFKKKTKYADVKKGTFPDIQFPDHEFDRIVASWSISTHMFPELKRDQFEVYWDEIDRLLKKDGVAIIWPIYRGNEMALAQSLIAYARSGGDACIFSIDPENDNVNPPVFAFDSDFRYALEDGHTLVIFPKNMSQKEKERLLGAVQKERGLKKSNPSN